MKHAIHSLVAAAAVLVAGCATVPRSFEIPKERIDAAITRKFPYERRAGDLLSVRVGAPRVQLLPESNRMRGDFGIDATERIGGRTVHADVGLSFALRYEPADESIRLADVRAERVDVEGVPSSLRTLLQPVAAGMAEQALEGTVVHAFTPQELARSQGLRPALVTVTSTGIRIDLQSR